MNWSHAKKFFVTFEIVLLTFSVYIGSAIYSAGEEDVERVFGVSQVVATLGLTLFVAGYGLGPMIWAPMSEIPQIGRNPVYIGTLFFFVLLQIPTALSVNIGMLLAFRFITGFVGSPSLATGGASIGDMVCNSYTLRQFCTFLAWFVPKLITNCTGHGQFSTDPASERTEFVSGV